MTDDLTKIREAWRAYQDAIEAKKQCSVDARDTVDAAQAGLREAMEMPLRAGAPAAEVRGKLEAIELAWQAVAEAKDQAVEAKKYAKDLEDSARVTVDRVIRQSAQTRLPGVE